MVLFLDVYLCTILLSGLCLKVRKESEKMLRRKQRRLPVRPWSWWRDWDRLRSRQKEPKMVWKTFSNFKRWLYYWNVLYFFNCKLSVKLVPRGDVWMYVMENRACACLCAFQSWRSRLIELSSWRRRGQLLRRRPSVWTRTAKLQWKLKQPCCTNLRPRSRIRKAWYIHFIAMNQTDQAHCQHLIRDLFNH